MPIDRLRRLAADGDPDAIDTLRRELARRDDPLALETLREALARDAARALRELLQTLGARALAAPRPVQASCAFAGYVARVGLVAELALRAAPRRSLRAELVVVPLDALPTWPAQLEALATRLETALGTGPDRLEAAWQQDPAEVLGVAELVVFDEDASALFAPTPLTTARRAAARDRSRDRFELVAAHTKQLYGLRLPRHVAVFEAMWRSLSPLEHRGLRLLGRSRSGIMVGFGDDGLGLLRPTRDGLDPRLEGRFRRDPPELLTTMSGDSDGLHYGLWYDDPAELPSCIAYNYARDGATTASTGRLTHRQVLADLVARQRHDAASSGARSGAALHALAAMLEAFADDDARALAEDGPVRYAGLQRERWLGGMAVALPPGVEPRALPGTPSQRHELLRNDPAQLRAWLEEARAALVQGQPALALQLGHELHWLDTDDTREAALELLVGAYEALGRHALAELARVHHAHRDLRSVNVYL